MLPSSHCSTAGCLDLGCHCRGCFDRCDTYSEIRVMLAKHTPELACPADVTRENRLQIRRAKMLEGNQVCGLESVEATLNRDFITLARFATLRV